ncbi:MAG TPA: glycoside hydrolase family 9 protein [Candidatus Binatia bacterium]|nr:glycoside hydrolase family 9 protein [Candidatus Binatia bacterium]
MGMRISSVGAGATLVALILVIGGANSAAGASTPAHAEVRVNQAGYADVTPIQAFAMLGESASSVSFRVEEMGRPGSALTGVSTKALGRWSTAYPAVFALDIPRLQAPGAYRIQLLSPQPAVSPWFQVASAADLYAPLLRNAVLYYTSERDGADVDSSVLDRQPANLTDEHAYVYANPVYDENDNLTQPLVRIGGPVDVSGGWFDAGGGYEKFGYTAAYTDALLLTAERDSEAGGGSLAGEAQFGLDWLTKLWNPVQKVLYIQVGIGNGGTVTYPDGTTQYLNGDYDFWFLPQQEDQLGAKPGDSDYYVEYRPVFEAAPPGQPISPDLAGRFAAAFALGAQLDADRDPAASEHLLGLAQSVYAMAQTTHVTSIVTTFPHDYYPGTQWKSDMLWGAAEIALAEMDLRYPRQVVQRALDAAGSWAGAYIAQGHSDADGDDTMNLYDDGAVGEADLISAIRQTGYVPEVTPDRLLEDLGDQVQLGEAYAEADADPFQLGTQLGSSDASPHAFGLYITDALYQEHGGSGRFQAFADQQIAYPLGANPWGSSFVVGAGTTFPHCMQGEIANLAGSLNGEAPLQLGATTDGPSSLANFQGLGTVTGMRACSVPGFHRYDNSVAGYEDNVVSWPSVEPADDYTAASLLAFALAASGPDKTGAPGGQGT